MKVEFYRRTPSVIGCRIRRDPRPDAEVQLADARRALADIEAALESGRKNLSEANATRGTVRRIVRGALTA